MFHQIHSCFLAFICHEIHSCFEFLILSRILTDGRTKDPPTHHFCIIENIKTAPALCGLIFIIIIRHFITGPTVQTRPNRSKKTASSSISSKQRIDISSNSCLFRILDFPSILDRMDGRNKKKILPLGASPARPKEPGAQDAPPTNSFDKCLKGF